MTGSDMLHDAFLITWRETGEESARQRLFELFPGSGPEQVDFAMHMAWTRIFLLVVTAITHAFLIQGCGTMENNRRWGEDVTLRPGWSKIGESALNAVSSPMVIAPAAAALILQIHDMDERLSSWAVRHTPTTGSNDRAERLSSDLRAVSLGSFYLSILATPSGNDPTAWCTSKAKGLAVQGGAAALSNEFTYLLKDTAGRKRPNGEDDESFPSGHASNAAVFTVLASRNVQTTTLSATAKTGMDIALHTVMFGVAWERVEAGVHYPSDVLAGIAMAYFIGAFVNDSFMGIGSDMVPVAGHGPDGYYIGLTGRF